VCVCVCVCLSHDDGIVSKQPNRSSLLWHLLIRTKKTVKSYSMSENHMMASVRGVKVEARARVRPTLNLVSKPLYSSGCQSKNKTSPKITVW